MNGAGVLAVMDSVIQRSGHTVASDVVEARAAVAKLIEAADSCAEAFYEFLDDEVPDVVAAEYPALARLTAALARVQGEAA